VATSPVSGDETLLARGAERYAIYCAPCHDVRGNGRGILYERGKVPTPSLHEERIRALPDGEIFDVVTQGKGLMPAYGYPIPPADRWAILAWVRHLQTERQAQEAVLAGAN
jgi:mono/diheme cytochrome c family protein